LREHLKRIHPETQPKVSDSTDTQTSAGTKPIHSFLVDTRQKVCSVEKSSKITQLVADWVSENMRPIGVVQDSGFKRLLGFVEPGYTVPSRTHVTSVLQKRHSSAKKELAKMLNDDAVAVAVTTDGWTSKATESYETFTVHFINSEWEMVSCVLETKKFSGQHTAEKLADHAVQVISSYVTDSSNVVAVLHDEAANMVKAGRILETA